MPIHQDLIKQHRCDLACQIASAELRESFHSAVDLDVALLQQEAGADGTGIGGELQLPGLALLSQQCVGRGDDLLAAALAVALVESGLPHACR